MTEPLGRVVAIFTAPDKGVPMEKQASVFASAGKGLEGDRYARKLGSFSLIRTEVVRHVTLISDEGFDASTDWLRLKGMPTFDRFETRRNIYTYGVDVNDLVGKEFLVGEVRMRGVELADPCNRPSALARKKGFREAFGGRAGIRAAVLTDGDIEFGSEIRLA